MRRGRRGDVRAAVLLLLEEQPRNGYQLMEESEQRSGGAWRPSPGSVYPVLSQLEDEGLISATADADGRKQFELTPLGKTTVEQQRAALGQPFDAAAARFGEPRIDLAYAMRHLHVATRQVMESGSQEQVSRAGAILKDARRQLYRLLGEEDEDQ
jgi:DNA-binding PadR family transcriptional regulator